MSHDRSDAANSHPCQPVPDQPPQDSQRFTLSPSQTLVTPQLPQNPLSTRVAGVRAVPDFPFQAHPRLREQTTRHIEQSFECGARLFTCSTTGSTPEHRACSTTQARADRHGDRGPVLRTLLYGRRGVSLRVRASGARIEPTMPAYDAASSLNWCHPPSTVRGAGLSHVRWSLSAARRPGRSVGHPAQSPGPFRPGPALRTASAGRRPCRPVAPGWHGPAARRGRQLRSFR